MSFTTTHYAWTVHAKLAYVSGHIISLRLEDLKVTLPKFWNTAYLIIK